MTYEEVVSVIDQFKSQYTRIVMSPKVHGIVVKEIEGTPMLVLMVTEKIEKEKLPADELMVENFSYNFNNENKGIKCGVEVSKIASIHSDVGKTANSTPVKGGDAAFGYGLPGNGTAGWNFYLNGVLVSMSNWHVFCPRGNNTPIGNRVIINGSDIASLYLFKPIYPASYNSLDFALAKFDNPSDVVGFMEQCEDGSVLPYPQKLSSNVRSNDGEIYTKVGARAPFCRSGRLVAIGDRQVDYGNGRLIWFSYQLIFTKMTDPGDSGAVIVRKSDNSVTGLNFAGGEDETIANPIFLNDWINIGTSGEDNSSGRIPMFESNSEKPGDFKVFFGNDLIPPDPIPDLSAGRVFLGVRIASLAWTGDIYQWHSPEIAPIRPNLPVIYVPGCVYPSSEFYRLTENRDTLQARQWIMLAFG